MSQKRALVLGAGGFIGHHLVDRLKSEGYFVHGADLKYPEFSTSSADEFFLLDLRDQCDIKSLFDLDKRFDEVYQMAGDMGGATYINCGDNDASVMSNSALININVAKMCSSFEAKKIFFPSSACVYGNKNDLATCREEDAYPAFPDNEYGWEKLFSERMYSSFRKNLGLNVRIARFHSIIGEESNWTGGKEKAHSALARKVAMVEDEGTIEVIGDGNQLRTFLHVEDCLNAVRLLMESSVEEVVNIGSDHLVSINEYVDLLKKISNKNFKVSHISGPTGVIGRECPIDKIKALLHWSPSINLEEATKRTYFWIHEQANNKGLVENPRD